MKRKRYQTIGATIVSTISAAFLLALTASGGVAAPVVTGTCTPSKVAFAASTTSANNATTTYVNIPQAELTFTQGGTSTSCVIVHFSAIANSYQTGFYLRAVMDGKAGLPIETYFHDTDTVLRTDSATFIFHNVAPGAHIVRLQFHSSGGTAVFIDSHNTIVNYAP